MSESELSILKDAALQAVRKLSQCQTAELWEVIDALEEIAEELEVLIDAAEAE